MLAGAIRDPYQTALASGRVGVVYSSWGRLSMASKISRCFAALAAGGGTFRVPLSETQARGSLLRRPFASKASFTGLGRKCSRPAGPVYRVWPGSGRGRARSYVGQAQGDVPVAAKLAEEVSSHPPPAARNPDNVFVPEIGATFDDEIDADVLEAEFSEVEEAEFATAEFEDFDAEEGGSSVKAEAPAAAAAGDSGDAVADDDADDDEDAEEPKETEKVTITIPYVPVPEAQKALEALFNARWTDMEPETKSLVIAALRTRNGILLDCWDAYQDVVRFSEVFKKLTTELDDARTSNTMPPDLLNDVCTQFLKYNKFLSAFDEDDADYLKKKAAGELGASMKKMQDSMTEFTKASRKSKKSKSSDPYGYDMNDMMDEYYDNYYNKKSKSKKKSSTPS